MQPIKFKPIFMERIWGGNKLKTKYNFNIPEDKKIGELWCISDNRTAVSVVDGGEFEGEKLNVLTKKFYHELYGSDTGYERFPLLIKIIDAQDKLSVQVHPDDDYASKYENGDSGKTEMWYIIDAKPGAKLICGLKEGTTKEEFKKLLKEEKLEDCLKEVEVNPGDVVYIPSGMVHAIGDGILICEIQQNSDLTYRVYDYNRVDASGKKRELHIDKAMDVINFDLKGDKTVPAFEDIEGGKIAQAVKSVYFKVNIIEVNKSVKISTDGVFNTLTVVEGFGMLKYDDNNSIMIKSGETILIPATIREYIVEGCCKIVQAFI